VSIYDDVMVLNVFGTAVKISDIKTRKELGAKYKHPHRGGASPQLDSSNAAIGKAHSETVAINEFRSRSVFKNVHE
jgi:hypothetical protein